MDGIALLGVWKGEQPWTLSLVSSQEKQRQSPVSSLWSVGVGWGGEGMKSEPALRPQSLAWDSQHLLESRVHQGQAAGPWEDFYSLTASFSGSSIGAGV